LLRLCGRPRAEAIRGAGLKLLLDENLSERIISLAADLFPGSTHIKTVGLREANDFVIWEWAKQHGFTIVSKGNCVWPPAKVHMAARWELPDWPDHESSEIALSRYSAVY
jgi:hypothetical protein